MAQTFLVPGEVQVASGVLWVVVEPVAEVQMCHPGGNRSGILAVHKCDIIGSGTILVEGYSPNVDLSGSWLGHRRNIRS